MIRLKMRIGDNPAVLEFADEAITIGRAASNHVALRDHRISRLHARIEWDGDEVQVFDLQSGNGTFLNGRRLRSGILKAGDVLVLGPVHLRILHLETTDGAMASVAHPVSNATEANGTTVLVPDSRVAPVSSRLRRRARLPAFRARG